MQRLHTLPSARLPTVWDRALRALRPAAQYAALAAACAAMHSLGAAVRVLGSLSVGLGVAWYGLRRSSLSPSGAAAVSGKLCGHGGWARPRGATNCATVLSSLLPAPPCGNLRDGHQQSRRRFRPPPAALAPPVAGGAAGRRHPGGQLPLRPAAAHLFLHLQQDHSGKPLLYVPRLSCPPAKLACLAGTHQSCKRGGWTACCDALVADRN